MIDHTVIDRFGFPVFMVLVLLGGYYLLIKLAARHWNGMASRLREIEDGRIADAKQHAAEYRELSLKATEAVEGNTTVLKELLVLVRSLHHPSSEGERSDGDTTALMPSRGHQRRSFRTPLPSPGSDDPTRRMPR